MAEPGGSSSGSGTPGGGGLGDAWREALGAHARYYEAWGQLTSKWMRDLAEASNHARLPSLPPLRLSTAPGQLSTTSSAVTTRSPAAPSSATRSSATTPSAEPPPPPAVLVLEGVAGEVVSAAFLVESSLPHAVDGVVEAEPFEDLDGAALLVRLDFEPAVVSLDSGERRLVRVSVELPATLPVNADCRSTIRVRGVPGTTIPIRLRRLGD
jgi:hypothetical protein